MAGTETLKEAAVTAGADYIKKKMGGSSPEEMTFKSLEELKSGLGLKIDTSSLGECGTIVLKREEFNKLKESLVGNEKAQLETFKKFLEGKKKTGEAAKVGLSELKDDLAKGAKTAAVATVAAGAVAGGVELAKKVVDAEGLKNGEKPSSGSFSDTIKNFFEGIKTLVALHLPWLAQLFGWKPAIPEKAQEAIDQGKAALEKGKEAIQGAPEGKEAVEGALAEERKLQEVMMKKKQKFKEDLAPKWGPKGEAGFEKVWTKHEKKMYENLKASKSMFSSDQPQYLMDIPLMAGAQSVDFLFDLLKEGVIPKDAIVAEIKEGAELAVEFSFSSFKDLVQVSTEGVRGILGRVSLNEFKQSYSNLKPEQQMLLGEVLYHKGVMLTYLLGTAGSVAMNAFIVPTTWHQRTGWNGVKQTFNTSIGKFDKAANAYTTLLNMLGKTDGQEALKLRNNLIEGYTKTLVTSAYLESGDDVGKFRKLLSEIKAGCATGNAATDTYISEHMLKKLTEVSESAGRECTAGGTLKNFVSGELKRPWNQADWTITEKFKSNFGRYFKGSLANSRYFVAENAISIESVSNSLSEVVRNKDSKISKYFAQLKGMLKMHEFNEQTGRAIASCEAKDVGRVGDLASRLLQESPSLARGFFNNLSIVVMGYAASQTADNFSGKMWNFAKSMTMFFPFVNVYYMAREGTQIRHGTLTQIGFLSVATAMAGMELYEVMRIAGSSDKGYQFFKYVARPIIAPIEFIGGASKTVVYTWEVLSGMLKAFNAGETAELGKLAARGAFSFVIIGALIACGAFGMKINKDMKEEDLVAELKKLGIIGKDGDPDPVKFREGIAKLNPTQKEYIVTLLGQNAVYGGMARAAKNNPNHIGKHEIGVSKKADEIKYRIYDMVTVADQHSISSYLKDFGITTKFEYTPESMMKYAQKAKQDGLTRNEFILAMKTLGMPSQVAEFYPKDGVTS